MRHDAFAPDGSVLLLITSLVVLALGPLVFRVSRSQPRLLPVVDGFVLASVGALAALFVLPAAIEQAGLWALGAAAAGLMLPTVLEKLSTRHRLVHGIGLALGVVGLLAHAITDGVALSTAHEGEYTLALAVVLHRLPVALAAWWLVRPLYGVVGASFVIALEGMGTVAGFFLGEAYVVSLTGGALGAFQAFVAGALLHVVVHRTPGVRAAFDARWRRAETIGAVLGALLVAFVPHGHGAGVEQTPHGALAYGPRFLHLALETAPALLVGYVLAGALVVVLPRASLVWVSKGPALVRALRGMAFGMPIPICSCGVVPVYQGLIRRGVPASAAMAFLVATPELGVDSLLLSLPLLGGELTVARLVAAVVVALLVGVVVGARVPALAHADVDDGERRIGWRDRVRGAVDFSLREVVDETAAWILFGLAIAAAIEPASLVSLVESFPRGLDVVLAAVVGVPLYVCASGATPLAAALLVAGLSPGAAVAFLLSGPATNVTTFGVLSRMHGRKVALAFGACVIGAAIASGLAVNALIAPELPPALVGDDERHGIVAWGALLVVAAVYGAALWRQGPRGFLANVLSLGTVDEHRGHDEHAHDHDDDHEHAHEAEGSCCGSCRDHA